jgi:peroxiredoxin Q/BCP
MATPEKSQEAPDFELPSADGETFRLSAQRGRAVVLYFYPEDDTPGCTIENQEFSALLPEFERLGVTVVGISADSIDKHCRFRDKYALKTVLLADQQHRAIDAYGVWGPKVTFGHHLIGLIRSSFLIDAQGRIAGAWRVTRIKGHAATVLAAAQALAG